MFWLNLIQHCTPQRKINLPTNSDWRGYMNPLSQGISTSVCGKSHSHPQTPSSKFTWAAHGNPASKIWKFWWPFILPMRSTTAFHLQISLPVLALTPQSGQRMQKWKILSTMFGIPSTYQFPVSFRKLWPFEWVNYGSSLYKAGPVKWLLVTIWKINGFWSHLCKASTWRSH